MHRSGSLVHSLSPLFGLRAPSFGLHSSRERPPLFRSAATREHLSSSYRLCLSLSHLPPSLLKRPLCRCFVSVDCFSVVACSSGAVSTSSICQIILQAVVSSTENGPLYSFHRRSSWSPCHAHEPLCLSLPLSSSQRDVLFIARIVLSCLYV